MKRRSKLFSRCWGRQRKSPKPSLWDPLTSVQPSVGGRRRGKDLSGYSAAAALAPIIMTASSTSDFTVQWQFVSVKTNVCLFFKKKMMHPSVLVNPSTQIFPQHSSMSRTRAHTVKRNILEWRSALWLLSGWERSASGDDITCHNAPPAPPAPVIKRNVTEINKTKK